MTPDRFPEDMRRRATYFAGGFLSDTDLRFGDLVYHMCLALEMERLEAWAREERLRELRDEAIRKLVEAIRMARGSSAVAAAPQNGMSSPYSSGRPTPLPRA